jgi:predicted ATPase/class 3 adenylate cyclase
VAARGAGTFPSGLVTFVFTDIVASTQLLRRIGDRYSPLLERHCEILRLAWRSWGGREVKTDGDSFFVAFADPVAAIAACAQGQRDLTSEPWPADAPIRVRMGLHTGLASPHGHDYIALAVHQAARVVDAGHGGQIVVSAETAQRAGDAGPWILTTLGRYRVRDFDEPVELFQVTGPDLPDGFAPLRVLPADRHNLVRAPTTIVGRDDDLDALAELVAAARLVSVVGPGGLGKTRLVTEFGLRAASAWEHGIWFVDLAPLSDPALIPQAVADAIAAPAHDDGDALAAVLEHLRDRHAALILDNCEHLTAAVARHVDALLRACPQVQVVTTSREPIGLRGERIWRLAPLAADDAAVRLFCDRAGLTGPLDESRRTTVVELCRLLDGLPLAIELAAARCDVLDPAEILARLGRQPTLLRSDDPTLSARQRSLDDTISWSHELLGADEQLAFRRLGVFAAGFGLEAPTAAIAGDDIDPYDVPELVWSLVSKSLVATEPAAGSTRYRMLDTVRAFAHRRLVRTGELAEVATRLGRHYVDSFGPQQQKSDAHLIAERSRESDNMRALVSIVAPHDEELAQLLACTIVVSQRRDSPRAGGDEGIRLLHQLTARTPTRVALLVHVVVLSIDQGLIDVATELLDEAELLAADVGAPPWVDGRIDQFRGIIAVHRGDIDGARSLAHAALGRTTSALGRSRVLNVLCMATCEQGGYDEAREAALGSLEISTLLGNIEACAVDLGNLAEIEMLAGNHHAAARRQLECLDLALELGALREVVSAWVIAARLASLSDDWAAATHLQSAADTTMARIGLSLYPMDRAVCDELLAAALARIGSSRFDAELERGRTLSVTDATGEARHVLASATAPG